MLKFLKSNLFFFLLLTAVVFSLYGKSIFFDFVYSDETTLILKYSDFLSDIRNLPKIFTLTCYYSEDFSYYRPFLNLSFMFETAIFGVNTKIYHLMNIILFILALLSMYVFLLKLKLNETILKFLILLVAVHPIFTSSIVWIPARNDTLLAIFVYLSFIFFINYLENKQIKDFICYFVFFCFALFTKESAILIIFLYFLFMWSFNYKLTKKEVLKNICITICIVLFYLFCRHIVISNGNNLLINLNKVVYNMFTGSIMYMYKFIVPNINLMIYNCKLNTNHFIVLMLSISFIIYCLFKKIIDKKVFIWCFISFVLFILPTTFLADYIILNHRLVILIPIIIIPMVLCIEKFIKFNNVKNYLILLYIVLFFIYSGISFNFQNNYENKNIYWVKSYIDAPNCHATCYFVSRLYFEKGNFEKAKEFLQKANLYGNNRYFSDLALIYCYEGKFNEAEELYNKSIQNGINKAQCYRNLSFIYFQRDNNINKALEYAKFAVKEDPYDGRYKQYLEELGKKQNEL